jgi:hypothetical protein
MATRGLSLGQAAIIRSELPDGSGEPLIPTGDYLFKPGISGGQTAHGDTTAEGELVLVSTAHATKGKIFLGTAQASAYAETQNWLGLGTVSPLGRLTLLAPTTAYDLLSDSLNQWTVYEAGVPSALSLTTAWRGDDDEAIYAAITGPGSATVRVDVTAPVPTTVTTWRITLRARLTAAPVHGTFTLVLYRSDGTPFSTVALDIDTTVPVTSWRTYVFDLTGNAGGVGSGPANTFAILYSPTANNIFYFAVSYVNIAAASGDSRTFVVKGQSGQAESLTDWRNSSNALLATVGPMGEFTIGSTTVGDGIVKLLLRGTSGQFADLFQIKNSSGTTFLNVDSTGKLVLTVGFQFTPGATLNFVMRSDGSGNGSWVAPSTLATRIQHRFVANGPYVVDTSVDGGFIPPTGLTITSVWVHRLTEGTSGSTTVQLRKNGTALFTSGARPTIAQGDPDLKSGPFAPDVGGVSTLVAGDILTMDIDVVEVGSPANLCITIEGA